MGESNAPGVSMLKDMTLPERYGLVRHIATGGMASVWCAEDQALGRRVAIKVLAERFAHDESAVRRFKREARTAARLSAHANVVTIYDVGETIPSGTADVARAFIVMEYLPGGTVADALRLASVTRPEAVRWLHEVASALDYAHGQGVLHRDIKPANLLLDRDRVVHVADFGIAQLSTEETLTLDGQVLGTAAYLAPERAVGRPATAASDRYSLAVAAFELLAGERPFGAERFAAQARQHIDTPAPRASERKPELAPELDAVLARGMAKRPEQRWPSARAFADAVDAALAETVVRGAPARAVARHTRRRRVGTAGTAAAAPGASVGNGVGGVGVGGVGPGGAEGGGAGVGGHGVGGHGVGGHGDGAGGATTIPRYRERRAPRRVIAVGALAAAALGVGVALGASHSSPPKPSGSSARAQGTATHAARRPVATRPKPKPAPKPKPQSNPRPQPQAAPSQVTATAAASTTPPPTADALEARGHGLMESGDYGAAIPVLRQALAAASPGSLTHAYAMYDLGRSLRLAGDPRAAVSVLYQRLQIPNQTGVVRVELQEALRELGKQAQKHGGKPGHGAGKPGHGAGEPGDGGGKPGHDGHGKVPGFPGGSPGDSGGVPGI
jgi:eukaryotic-like serine/threonine-protein kinase